MEDISKVVRKEDLDDLWVRWKCLNCGYLYEGLQKTKKCPRCGNEDNEKFVDIE